MAFMVIDDEASMRALIAALIEKSGLADQVLQCASAEDALLDLELQPIELIVSDWNMPGMSGLELLKRIRTAPELAHVRKVPVILLTAQRGRQSVIEAAVAGVSDYVVKPFTPSQLVGKIATVCRRHGLAREAEFSRT